MIRITGILFLLGLGLAIDDLPAQSLDSLWSELQENNPQLQALTYSYRSASMQGRQLDQLPDPQLGIGFFALQPETRVGPQWFRIGLSQQLPWKGSLDAKRQLLDLQAGSVELMILEKRQQLYLELAMAWFDLLQIQEETRILNEHLTLFQSLEELALIRMESGSGPLSDLLLIQLKRAETEHQLEILETERKDPGIRIQQLLGRNTAAEVILAEVPEPIIMVMNREMLLDRLVEQHPLLQQLELQGRISQQRLEVNRLDGMPDFQVGLDYLLVSRRTDAAVPDNGKDVLMPRLGVSLPIYRKKYAYKEREEDLRMQSIEQQVRNTRDLLRRDLDLALVAVDKARQDFEFYEAQQERLQQVFDLYATEFSTNGRQLEELLRMQQELLQYELEQVHALINGHRAGAAIQSLLIL